MLFHHILLLHMRHVYPVANCSNTFTQDMLIITRVHWILIDKSLYTGTTWGPDTYNSTHAVPNKAVLKCTTTN